MINLKKINTKLIVDFASQNADLLSQDFSRPQILKQLSDTLILFLNIEKKYYKSSYQAVLDRMALIDEGYTFDEALDLVPHTTKTTRRKK